MRRLWLIVLAACGGGGTATPIDAAHANPDAAPRALPFTITIHPGDETTSADGIVRSQGGDTDVEVVSVGAVNAARTGNGAALPSSDGNQTADHYLQLDLPDAIIDAGAPTGEVVVTVEYWDSGTDGFALEYDGGMAFERTRTVVKTDTGALQRERFVIADAYFGDRDNGGDLRIDDLADGAETIRSVSFELETPPHVIDVDSCGANPLDDLPDSDAIQQCIDRAVSGDVVRFTSPAGNPSYRGYLIDKTLFLVGASPARARLTFTSSDPSDRAKLQATPGLLGFVIHLFARSALSGVEQGQVDDITLAHLAIDGDRADRFCYGPNGVFDGVDDNWGSLRTECTVAGDAWCLPGSVALDGAFDGSDAAQDAGAHPDSWSTGLVADDLAITNTTCGTALGLNGADSAIARTTVDTAGDHVHGAGCTKVKAGEPVGDWSDGFTVLGPGMQITDDLVSDPSDVGVVLFGGHRSAVAGDTIRATAGNHGMFAAIAIHAWTYGEVGHDVIARNVVDNAGDATCGGIHAGINLGPHMWGGACANASAAAVGAPVAAGPCPDEPAAPGGAACPASGRCQQWAYASSLALVDNQVTGADVNYLIEGLDGPADALVDRGNASTAPRATDWDAAVNGCNGVTWAPADRIAHHPSRSGWLDVRVHCER